MLVAARNEREEPAGVLEQYVEGSDRSMTPQPQADTHSQQKSDEKCGLKLRRYNRIVHQHGYRHGTHTAGDRGYRGGLFTDGLKIHVAD